MSADDGVELTILMPCLNEALTIEVCVRNALGFLRDNGVVGEVLIADNGSTDGSQELARALGARVIEVPEKGYGSALFGGIMSARGRFTIMGDADDSYDFTNLGPFLARLRAGDDLVMGNRFKGGIAPGAMPPLHRYLGNPVLSTIGRLLFRSEIRDFHCGLRGFNTQSMRDLGLVTTGMEFASEMVVKSTLAGRRISEVPTTLKPDGRDRPPHLRSWRDGWRHLKFLLIYSPDWLFLIPGLVCLAIGVIGVVALAFGQLTVGSVSFSVATQAFAAALAMIGYQSVLFAVLVKRLAARRKLWPAKENALERLAGKLSVEAGAFTGIGLAAVGIVVAVAEVITWGATGWGNLDPAQTLRLTTPAALAMVLGVQTFTTSMLYGVITVETSRDQ